MLRLPSLAHLLAYRHPELVARFARDYGMSRRDSQLILTDLLRFLWLSVAVGTRPQPRDIAMSVAIIDEMWHTFLLYSEDYQKFCLDYFGVFLHHDPERILTPRGTSAERREQEDAAIECAWRELGPRIARRWYDQYQRAYPKRTIRRNQLAAVRARAA